MKDLTGFKNKYLTVLSLHDIRYNRMYYWKCLCSCGQLTFRSTYEITSEKIKHCRKCKLYKKTPRKTYNRTKVKNNIKSHGLADKHPLYKTWINIRQRCYNPNNPKYRIYGGVGIQLCDEWKANFYLFYKWSLENGWAQELTIDRIDPTWNYCPFNCQFITRSENTKRVHELRKKRFTKNKI